MASFALCAACRREYDDPADRRFHAQPTACPACGPRLQILAADGTQIVGDPLTCFVAALRAVLRGEPSFDAAHPRRPAGQSALSRRERDVLRLAGRGATNREIANELKIGDQTVKTLLARSYAKLGVRRRADAVAVARGLGLLAL